MVCQHLRELYDLCEKNQLRLGGADLVRIVCRQCNQEETCPSVLAAEYDSDYHSHRSEGHPDQSTESSKTTNK